jgi:hypothetical protein
VDRGRKRRHASLRDLQAVARVDRIRRSLVYLLNQGEILATAVPGFPEIEIAGLLGSTLWAVWLLLVGASLIRAGRDDARG